jgi:hypothetical protein
MYDFEGDPAAAAEQQCAAERPATAGSDAYAVTYHLGEK